MKYKWIWFLVALNVFDVIGTYNAFSMGIQEANPLLQAFGIWGIAGIKAFFLVPFVWFRKELMQSMLLRGLLYIVIMCYLPVTILHLVFM